jgi:hypothetical protein
MPIHDWTKVDAGIFHAFHLHWIAAIDSFRQDHAIRMGFTHSSGRS